jgi:hypothetical protein
MITINGEKFHEIPCVCCVCRFFHDPNPKLRTGDKNTDGTCMLFKIRKRKYDNIPARCRKLFEKGFAIGRDLVITYKKYEEYEYENN